MLSYTARLRESQLHAERERTVASGRELLDLPDPIENPSGDFTQRMVRELEAKRVDDEKRKAAKTRGEEYESEFDPAWLHLYGQPDTSPKTWESR